MYTRLCAGTWGYVVSLVTPPTRVKYFVFILFYLCTIFLPSIENKTTNMWLLKFENSDMETIFDNLLSESWGVLVWLHLNV